MDGTTRSNEGSTKQPSPRSGAIELLQLGSVLSLGLALLLGATGRPWLCGAAAAAAAILFAVPFWLLKVPEQRRSGFVITRWRRQTVAELGVPPDILLAIDERMLGVYYERGEDLHEALCRLLGQERVQPWSDLIVCNAQVHGGPSRELDGDEAEARAPEGIERSRRWRPLRYSRRLVRPEG